MASPAIGQATAIVLTGADPCTTAAITTTASGSSFFVCFVTSSSATITDVTDSKSNTYSLLGSVVNTNEGQKMWVYYTENGTGGSSHTFTANPNSANAHAVVGIEVTGAATASIVDASNTAYDTSTPWNCSVTSTVDDTLFLAFIANSSASGTWQANGSFTLGESASTGASIREAWAYKQVAGASANDPAWTSSNAANASTLITVAIKSSGGAATGQPTMTRFGGTHGARGPGRLFGRSWKEANSGILTPNYNFNT